MLFPSSFIKPADSSTPHDADWAYTASLLTKIFLESTATASTFPAVKSTVTFPGELLHVSAVPARGGENVRETASSGVGSVRGRR